MDQSDAGTVQLGHAAKPDMSGAEIHQRLQASDVSALQDVYKQYSPAIYGLCMRMMRDSQRAEEIMQDTFWQLWSKPDRFDPARGKLATFLFQIARSRCLDRLRSERSQTERIRAAHGELDPDARDHAGGPTPLDSAMSAENRKNIRRALDSLPQGHREAIILTYFDGLSQSEVAEKLGTPLGTVKTRVRRGLLQLRKNLIPGPAV